MLKTSATILLYKEYIELDIMLNKIKSLIAKLLGITEATSKTELLLIALPESVRLQVETKIQTVHSSTLNINGAQKQKLVVDFINQKMIHEIPLDSKAGKLIFSLPKEKRKHLLNALVSNMYQRIIE